LKKLFFLLLLTFGCLWAWALPVAANTTWEPGALALGLDARSFGMGGACLTVLDAWAEPYNPAALPFLPRQGFWFGRFTNPYVDSAELKGDQLHLHLGYLHPETENGAYAITAYRHRFLWDYIGVVGYNHSYTDLAVFQYGYGYRLNERLALGFNVRRVAQTDEIEEEATGALLMRKNTYLSFDIGGVFRLNKAIAASVLVTDVFAPKIHFNLGGTDYLYDVTPRVLFGGAFRLGDFFIFALDLDGDFINFDELLAATRIGVEIRPLPFVAIRSGCYHGWDTIGFGLRLGRMEGLEMALDFAQYWPNEGDILSRVQTWEMTIRF